MSNEHSQRRISDVPGEQTHGEPMTRLSRKESPPRHIGFHLGEYALINGSLGLGYKIDPHFKIPKVTLFWQRDIDIFIEGRNPDSGRRSSRRFLVREVPEGKTGGVVLKFFPIEVKNLYYGENLRVSPVGALTDNGDDILLAQIRSDRELDILRETISPEAHPKEAFDILIARWHARASAQSTPSSSQ